MTNCVLSSNFRGQVTGKWFKHIFILCMNIYYRIYFVDRLSIVSHYFELIFVLNYLKNNIYVQISSTLFCKMFSNFRLDTGYFRVKYVIFIKLSHLQK